MTETGREQIVWRLTQDYAERTRIARFMRSLGVSSLEELQRRSVADPDWYWDAVVRDLGLRFTRPYTRVRDVSRGVQWPRWFEGGLMNFADNCVDRHLEGGRGEQAALIWEGDDGRTRSLSYRELASEVNQLANALKRLGVGEGDRVGVFLPMSPEAAIATLAVVRIGAIYTPCFSGYGAQAVASRLQDCEARVLVTADGFYRRGQIVKMKETADEAVAASPSVRTVIVYKRLGREIPWTEGRDRWWHELIGQESDVCAALPGAFDRPCLIIYTSGTTGRPKGAVLTQGGFLLKCAHDFGYLMDVGPGDRLFWLTDLGWLMGPMLITAGLFHGGTAVLFEGVPDFPKPDRLWSLVENAGKARVPIINYTGGTEISGGILSSFPIAPIKPCSFTGPIPGMAADCFGEDGRPVRGQVGELVVTAPWPGMTQGFWKDPQRYEETYWSRWPNVWVHGDWAYVDEDGFWFMQGRSDDTLKIAGKRLGPAEVESVLVSHEAVAEAGVVGVPHEVKGEAIVCFVVLRPSHQASEPLRTQLSDLIARQMGKALKPERVLFTKDLPKTRSAKIMRRVIRATYLGKEPGDLSSLENPNAVKAITEAS